MKNYLRHYGILGMKWGVRRYQNKDGTLTGAGRRRKKKIDKQKTISPEQLTRAKGNVDSVSTIVRETKNINTAVNKSLSIGKVEDLKEMTDKELQVKIQRLNMEQQYRNLSSNKTTKGQDYLINTLDVAGSALAVTGSALAIALSIKALKKGGE